MNFFKILKKIYKVISRFCIKQLAHIDSNLYTKKYSMHLKKYGVDIEGLSRYIATTAIFDGNNYSIINLGNYCVISSEAQLLTHDYSIARGLQSIGKNNPIPNKDELILKGIYIGDNSFIGTRTTLLPGAHIGNNVIVGACSVVKGTIQDNCIVVGNLAKVIADTIIWAEKNILKRNIL